VIAWLEGRTGARKAAARGAAGRDAAGRCRLVAEPLRYPSVLILVFYFAYARPGPGT
jgi:hypothetical protein